jgi:negative regulator of sigma-B (phosphoserine phosphatase)
MIATPGQDLAMLDWAWAGAALEGDESGDACLVAPLPHGALLAVIDGLGHGPEAAVAAREATSLLQVRPERPSRNCWTFATRACARRVAS